jgi:type I restriction enzyme S subunit
MMPRYNAYKDSGIEWIGEIPEHWYLNNVKRTTYVKGRIGWKGLRSDDFLTQGPFLITGTDFGANGELTWDNMYHVSQERYDEDPFIQVKEGDVLITKDGTIGKIVYINSIKGPTCLNSGVFVTRPITPEYISRFFYWVIKSSIFNVFVDYNSGGSTILHLYQNVFENFTFPIPTVKEQTQIVECLDAKTALIDKLISVKQQKIELLKEKRNALINQAVTKGLDSNVKMKKSGVEWIGKIPEHWGYKKITHCFNLIGSGTTPSSTTSEYYENGKINWLQTGDLTDNFITRTSKLITQKAFDDLNLKIYPSNSLIIAMYGATIGKIGLLKIDTTTNQACCVLADPKGVYVNYVFYWFIANKDRVVSLGYGGGQPNISQETIKSLRIHCPPTEEQAQIVTYLDKETKKIDNLLNLEQKKIDLLKEYRQSLISEVVTGKIKVTKD